ncbi:MAG: cobalamin-binding protein [Bacteroidota bacterium]|nr:cobalamin-binding protein [Bacteroidota bacterium]
MGRCIARFSLPLLVACVALFAATGCSRSHERGDLSGIVTVKDDLGREVTFAAYPRRVVALAPNLTECVFAIGCGDRLVGVTRYCDYPPEALRIERVGDMVNPSIEAIVSREPDLVLISTEGNARATFDRLDEIGIKTLISNPRTLSDILGTIGMLGEALGARERARRVQDSLAAFIRPIRGRYGPRVLFLVSLEPLMTVGRGSFLDALITAAGLENAGAAGKGRYPVLGREEVVRADPSYILLSSDLATDSASAVRLFPEWRRLRAGREGGIRIANADIFLRPGPRAFEGLQILSELAAQRRQGYDIP